MHSWYIYIYLHNLLSLRHVISSQHTITSSHNSSHTPACRVPTTATTTTTLPGGERTADKIKTVTPHATTPTETAVGRVAATCRNRTSRSRTAEWRLSTNACSSSRCQIPGWTAPLQGRVRSEMKVSRLRRVTVAISTGMEWFYFVRRKSGD